MYILAITMIYKGNIVSPVIYAQTGEATPDMIDEFKRSCVRCAEKEYPGYKALPNQTILVADKPFPKWVGGDHFDLQSNKNK
jgi:hypothetical protein